MVRIAGVDVPDRKRAHVALRSIYGIGPKIAQEILIKADLDPVIPPRMNELSEEQIDRIRELVDQDYISPAVPWPAEAGAAAASSKRLRLSEIYLWLDPGPGDASVVQCPKEGPISIPRSIIR